MKKTIVVLGAGHGCGNRVAEKFGNNDFPGGKCDPALLAEDFWKMYVERGECEMMH